MDTRTALEDIVTRAYRKRFFQNSENLKIGNKNVVFYANFEHFQKYIITDLLFIGIINTSKDTYRQPWCL